MRHLTILLLTLCSVSAQDCSVFEEGACPLTEENIVGSDRFTENPQDCQNICRETAHSDCMFFTHFNTECYLLSSCDSVEPCDGCLSGPPNPLLSDCQDTTIGTTTMPPTGVDTTIGTSTMPPTTWDTSTMPPTTVGTTIGTTTMDMTTTAADSTTGPPTTHITSTPSMEPTTTTMVPCDVDEGVICDDPASLIEHIEHISHASDCQAICQNHPECNFWSHYAEEGHEHWGHCLIYTDCGKVTSHECHDAGTHECPPPPPRQSLFQPLVHGKEPRPGPGGPKCHCQSGGNSPDLDECDDGSTGCEDYFAPGYLCDDGDLQEIEGIASASDCQALCQNHEECQFFSYWTEEHEHERGWCYFHTSCNQIADEECHQWGQCYCGPQYPDLDDCTFPQL